MNSLNGTPNLDRSFLKISNFRRHTICEANRDQFISQLSAIELDALERQDSDEDEPRKPPKGPPYHVFNPWQKRLMVYIVSFAGFFSPLSSNIYFPALGAISHALNVSMSLVSLTITSYMVVQGIAPSIWGPLSDVLGRRQLLIATMTVYLIANIVLGFSDSFPVLLIFRGVQAAGSASTISIGAGVIGDVTTPAERGAYIGVFGGIRMFGQSVGPVFGGILTQFLGFHSIFWALTILGGISLLLILLLLPETLRSIAGDGTVPLVGRDRPLVYLFRPQPYASSKSRPDQPKKKVTLATMIAPMKYLVAKDLAVSLVYGAIVYTIWSMVTSTTTSLFQVRYDLNNLEMGIAFLPNGLGCVLGSYMTGLLMDRDFRRTVEEYRKQHDLDEWIDVDVKSTPQFPIERARQRSIWYLVAPFIFCTGAYGFSLTLDIDLPLILQFFIAYTATAVFSINSALVVDLIPGNSATATAVNNLIRCSLGAVGVGVAQPLVDALGPPYAFLGLAVVALLGSPLLVVESKWGSKWRRERLRC